MQLPVRPVAFLALTFTVTCLLALSALLVPRLRTAVPVEACAGHPNSLRPGLGQTEAPVGGAGACRGPPAGRVHAAMVWAWRRWTRRRAATTREQQLCSLRELALRGSEVLQRDRAAGTPGRGALPALPLARQLAGQWRRCAVVMNAGSLLRAQLGSEIDAHDAVMRFNSAPTAGYELHVGNKTNIRLINWQIVNHKEFNFETSELYRDIILVMWGPPPYTCTKKNERNVNLTFPASKAYFKWRRERPHQAFYLLHPCFRLGLWKLVQRNFGQEPISTNPTSSGLLGVALMMSLCEEVHVYDFIPPRRRAAEQCHYFEPAWNSECTLGLWHPLMQEKLMATYLSSEAVEQVFLSGRLTMPGLAKLTCPTQ